MKSSQAAPLLLRSGVTGQMFNYALVGQTPRSGLSATWCTRSPAPIAVRS